MKLKCEYTRPKEEKNIRPIEGYKKSLFVTSY
jgi:hypothetical protein